MSEYSTEGMRQLQAAHILVAEHEDKPLIILELRTMEGTPPQLQLHLRKFSLSLEQGEDLAERLGRAVKDIAQEAARRTAH